jgi:hypothetical protein
MHAVMPSDGNGFEDGLDVVVHHSVGQIESAETEPCQDHQRRPKQADSPLPPCYQLLHCFISAYCNSDSGEEWIAEGGGG